MSAGRSRPSRRNGTGRQSILKLTKQNCSACSGTVSEMTVKVQKDDGSYDSYDDVDEFMAAMDRRFRARPWHYKLRMHARREWNKYMRPSPYRKARWFIQRGRRGWADCDVWSFDWYITKVMSQGIARLADVDHGWPGEGSRWPTHEEFIAYLRDLSGRLGRWNAADDSWDEEAYEVTAGAVREVGDPEVLGHLWD